MYRNALTCWQSDQRGMFRHKKRSTNGDDKSRPSRAGTSGDVDSRTGVLPDGSCLAGAKAAAFAGATVDCHWEASPPRFDGTLEAFAAAHATEAALVAQLRNIVKKCSCGKVCGFSLTECNACGKPLPAETSHSPNVFSGFIYGIASAPFPLHISIRRQSAQLLVFDDLLALTPCHLNAVPTSAYIPDWRFLLRRPREGLLLVRTLEEAAWACACEEFLASPSFRHKFLRGAARTEWTSAHSEALRPHMVVGANFPPSQFQLHLQCFLMPWLPFQYRMYLDGQHMTKGRFFPLSYIKALLSLDEPYEVQMETPVEEIIAHFATRGVDYDEMHAACYLAVDASHRALANWSAADFECTLQGGSVVGSDRTKAEVIAADKLVLQSYGRPYSQQGKPAGTFYKHARSEATPTWA